MSGTGSHPTASAVTYAVAVFAAALSITACGGGGSDADGAPSDAGTNPSALEEPGLVVAGQPTAAGVQELIERRAGALSIVEHRRLIDGDHAMSASVGEGLTQIEHVVHDARGGAIVASGSRHDGPYTEDIRIIEYEGKAHVIRDLYAGPFESQEFGGRGIPVHLEGEDFFEESARTMHTLAADMREGAPTESAVSALAAAPTLSGIKGVTNSLAGISDGKVAMSCGKLYNDARVINDATGTYPWTLTGANFGAATGIVSVAGRTSKVVSWSSTSIKIDPTVPTSWGPMSTTFTIQTTAGTKGTFGVSIAPAIKSRIFGQCTRYVASQRLQLGFQPSPSAYDSYMSISSSYVPKVGDQFQWGRQHTAIVLAVATATSGSTKTYTLTVGEQNAKCTNAISKYTTRFQTSTTPSGLVVTERPKSSISGLSSYETLYYR